MGRPTLYDPVVYGLHDGRGQIFYVGKSTNLTKRLGAYRNGHCHGNRRLKAKLAEHGLNHVILAKDPADLHAAEFDEIESRPGLVNLITDRHMPTVMAASDKPWSVPGVRCPTAQYMTAMNNRFHATCGWLKKEIEGMSDDRRMAVECKFAETLMTFKVPGVEKWVRGFVARYAPEVVL